MALIHRTRKLVGTALFRRMRNRLQVSITGNFTSTQDELSHSSSGTLIPLPKKINFSEQSLVAEAHDGTIVNRKFSWNTSKCGIYRSFSSSRIPLRMSSGHFHLVCSRIGLGLSCRLLGFLAIAEQSRPKPQSRRILVLSMLPSPMALP
jgi:hypothetical protein